jgi:Domain of unknown function (DUF4124)
LKIGLQTVLQSVIALSFLTGVCAHAQQKQQQKVYRWVDDNGVVHYGDSVPPEYASVDRDILNEQGVAVGFEEGVITAEEQEQIDRAAAAAEAERQARVEAARRDRVLLETYLSVEEIEALRDRRLELLESQIKVTEQYLTNLRKRLDTLQTEAKVYKPVSADPDAPDLPNNLRLDTSRTLASIRLYEQTLTLTRTEQETLRTAFAADIDRFRQLKGIKPLP